MKGISKHRFVLYWPLTCSYMYGVNFCKNWCQSSKSPLHLSMQNVFAFIKMKIIDMVNLKKQKSIKVRPCISIQYNFEYFLTLPDTWFLPPFWDLLVLQLLITDSSNLQCLYATFHLEYLLVRSRFCFRLLLFQVKSTHNRAVMEYVYVVFMMCCILLYVYMALPFYRFSNMELSFMKGLVDLMI